MMQHLLEKMLVLLEADGGYIEVRCPFFVTKKSPVSHLKSLMNYKVGFIAEHKNGQTRITQRVIVPVTSLCPCSREISDYGAQSISAPISSFRSNWPMKCHSRSRFASPRHPLPVNFGADSSATTKNSLQNMPMTTRSLSRTSFATPQTAQRRASRFGLSH